MTRAGIRAFWAAPDRAVPRVRLIEMAPVVDASDPLRDADDPGRPGHALHAGDGAIAACAQDYVRGVLGAVAERPAIGGWHMTQLLPFPLVSAGLLILWLLLNQTLSLGQILLGSLTALVGGWALTALQLPKARMRRPGAMFRLSALVLADIVRSNIAVAASSWASEGASETPGFVNIPLDLRDPYGLAALACIITSTPGTLWVDFDAASGMLMIHVLDPGRRERVDPHDQGSLRTAAAGDIRMSTVLLGRSRRRRSCWPWRWDVRAFRILWGPRAQDRVVGFDSLYVNAMLLLLTFGIRSGSTLYFEAALIIALLGFVGTVALAKFLLRGEVIE